MALHTNNNRLFLKELTKEAYLHSLNEFNEEEWMEVNFKVTAFAIGQKSLSNLIAIRDDN